LVHNHGDGFLLPSAMDLMALRRGGVGLLVSGHDEYYEVCMFKSPRINPETGKPFGSDEEMLGFLEQKEREFMETVKEDFTPENIARAVQFYLRTTGIECKMFTELVPEDQNLKISKFVDKYRSSMNPMPRMGKRAEVWEDTFRVTKEDGNEAEIDVFKTGEAEKMASLDLTKQDMIEGKTPLEYAREGIEKMELEKSHEEMLLSMLSLLEHSPPDFYTFDDLYEDLFGFASPEKNAIALHESLQNNPVALFHEMSEYLRKSFRIDVEYKGFIPRILNRFGLYERFKGARWLRGDIIVRINEKNEIRAIPIGGEALSIALKDINNPHYLLRAMQRQAFGDKDRELTEDITFSLLEEFARSSEHTEEILGNVQMTRNPYNTAKSYIKLAQKLVDIGTGDDKITEVLYVLSENKDADQEAAVSLLMELAERLYEKEMDEYYTTRLILAVAGNRNSRPEETVPVLLRLAGKLEEAGIEWGVTIMERDMSEIYQNKPVTAKVGIASILNSVMRHGAADPIRLAGTFYGLIEKFHGLESDNNRLEQLARSLLENASLGLQEIIDSIHGFVQTLEDIGVEEEDLKKSIYLLPAGEGADLKGTVDSLEGLAVSLVEGGVKGKYVGGILDSIGSKTLVPTEKDAVKQLADRLRGSDPAASFSRIAGTLEDAGVSERGIKKTLGLIYINESDDPNTIADSFRSLTETLDRGGLSSGDISVILHFLLINDNPCKLADRLRVFDPGVSFERLTKTLRRIGAREGDSESIISYLSAKEKGDPNKTAGSFISIAESLVGEGLSGETAGNILVQMSRDDDPQEFSENFISSGGSERLSSIIQNLRKAGFNFERIIVNVFPSLDSYIHGPVFEFITSDANKTIMEERLKFLNSINGMRKDKDEKEEILGYVIGYYNEKVRRDKKLVFLRGINNVLAHKGITERDTKQDWEIFLEEYIMDFGFLVNRDIVLMHRFLRQERPINEIETALEYSLGELGISSTGEEGMKQLEGCINKLKKKIFEDRDIPEDILEHHVVKALAGSITGFYTAAWGRGARDDMDIDLKDFVERFHDDVKKKRIPPLSKNLRNLEDGKLSVHKEGVSDFIDHEQGVYERYKELAMKAKWYFSEGPAGGSVGKIKEETVEALRSKIGSMEKSKRKLKGKKRKFRAVIEGNIAALEDTVRKVEQSGTLMDIAECLLADKNKRLVLEIQNERSLADIIILCQIVETLSPREELRASLFSSIDKELSRTFIEALAKVRKNVPLAKVEDRETRKNMLKTFDISTFEHAITRIDETAETVEVRAFITKGILGEMAGDIGDACYTHLQRIMGYKNMVGTVIFEVGDEIDREFIGSMLILQNKIKGEKTWIMRAVNPREGFMRHYSGESFLREALEYVKSLAEKEDVQHIVIPSEMATATSENEKIKKASKIMGGRLVTLDEIEDFNDRDITEDCRLLWSKDPDESGAPHEKGKKEGRPQMGKRAEVKKRTFELTPEEEYDAKVEVEVLRTGETDTLELKVTDLDLRDRILSGMGKMQLDTAHGSLLGKILFSLNLEPSGRLTLFKFDRLIADLFGFPVTGYGAVGIHESLSNNTPALFHELMEYAIDSGEIKLALKEGRKKGKIIILNETGKTIGELALGDEALPLAKVDPLNQHYLLRALQREVFGEEDRELSKEISLCQLGGIIPQESFDKIRLSVEETRDAYLKAEALLKVARNLKENKADSESIGHSLSSLSDREDLDLVASADTLLDFSDKLADAGIEDGAIQDTVCSLCQNDNFEPEGSTGAIIAVTDTYVKGGLPVEYIGDILPAISKKEDHRQITDRLNNVEMAASLKTLIEKLIMIELDRDKIRAILVSLIMDEGLGPKESVDSIFKISKKLDDIGFVIGRGQEHAGDIIYSFFENEEFAPKEVADSFFGLITLLERIKANNEHIQDIVYSLSRKRSSNPKESADAFYELADALVAGGIHKAYERRTGIETGNMLNSLASNEKCNPKNTANSFVSVIRILSKARASDTGNHIWYILSSISTTDTPRELADRVCEPQTSDSLIDFMEGVSEMGVWVPDKEGKILGNICVKQDAHPKHSADSLLKLVQSFGGSIPPGLHMEEFFITISEKDRPDEIADRLDDPQTIDCFKELDQTLSAPRYNKALNIFEITVRSFNKIGRILGNLAANKYAEPLEAVTSFLGLVETCVASEGLVYVGEDDLVSISEDYDPHRPIDDVLRPYLGQMGKRAEVRENTFNFTKADESEAEIDVYKSGTDEKLGALKLTGKDINPVEAAREGIDEMELEESHKDLLIAVLKLFEHSPPVLYTFGALIEDLSGFVLPQKNVIALHKDFAEKPVPIIHEFLEYTLDQMTIGMEISANKEKLIVYINGETEGREIDIVDAMDSLQREGEEWADWSAEELNTKPHYLFRILQRAIFKDLDKLFTDRIKSMQLTEEERIKETGNALTEVMSRVRFPEKKTIIVMPKTTENMQLFNEVMKGWKLTRKGLKNEYEMGSVVLRFYNPADEADRKSVLDKLGQDLAGEKNKEVHALIYSPEDAYDQIKIDIDEGLKERIHCVKERFDSNEFSKTMVSAHVVLGLGLIDLARNHYGEDEMRGSLIDKIAGLLSTLGDEDSAAKFRRNWKHIFKGLITIKIKPYSEELKQHIHAVEQVAKSL